MYDIPPLSSASNPKQNELLAALPISEWLRWLPQLEVVDMPLGKVLYESGGKMTHVYFPTTCIVSLLHVMEDGSTAETAVVGREGVVGVPVFMGGSSTTSRAVVQSAGFGYRLEASFITQEFNRTGPVLQLLLHYTQALITQMAQTAVCNRHHSLDQQLCRSLLLHLDRLNSNELVMTQELIANMLGVRREGVTTAAGQLQDAGLISYRRGHITVRDRRGLERRSCECYGVVKNEYDRLLPPTVERYKRPLFGSSLLDNNARFLSSSDSHAATAFSEPVASLTLDTHGDELSDSRHFRAVIKHEAEKHA